MLRLGDAAGARELASAAIRVDRFDEAAHRVLMMAHRATGETASALVAYERLRSDLAEQLGVDPAPETRAVHQALLVEAPIDAPSPRITEPVLAGRSSELARLGAVWSAATDGRPGFVLLAGEGGIGKTRLADEFATSVEAAGARVLIARCYAGERSLFLQPFLDAVGPELAALPGNRLRVMAGPRAAALLGLWPELAGALGTAVTPLGSEIGVRHVFEVLTAVIGGLTDDRPVLVLLDDLHNAGLASIELLHYMMRHVGRSRLLVVATMRVGAGSSTLDVLDEVAERVPLGPLPDEAVIGLAQDAGQSEHAATILRRTRGHPLFVVEILRSLAAGESGPPETLLSAVLAQLGRAGSEVEAVVRAGAVLGATVDPDLVGKMLDLAPHEAAQRCEQAVSAGLLVVADRSYEFANDVIQEVLYASTAVPLRVAYHRRAADLSVDKPETVAAHALAAQDWLRAARAFLLAGEQAPRNGTAVLA
jgi:hypothetical protein